MAVGQNEAVTILALGIGRVVAQKVLEQIRKNICKAQRTAGVTALGPVHHSHRVYSDLTGQRLQRGNLIGGKVLHIDPKRDVLRASVHNQAQPGSLSRRL